MKTLVVCLGLALLAGCAAQSEGASSSADAIQGGSTDATSAHNYAVGIANKLGTVCSGTLIAPNLVLTARHCVVDPDATEAVTCADSFGATTDVANLFVSTDPVLSGKANLYSVAEIATPTDDSFCGNDIALVRLDKNIPAAEAEPATPVVQFSITDSTRLSGQIAAVGYGDTSPTADDPGTRRLREDIAILCIPGDSTYDCTKTSYASLLDSQSDGEFITQGYVCAGDSGSGAFDQRSFTSGGAPYVLGALSRGPSNDTECLAAIYSRTDVHADLIIAAATKAAQLGGYATPDWATSAAVASTDPTTTTCSNDICTAVDATDPASSVEPKAANGCAAAPGSRRSSAMGLLLAVAAIATIRRRKRA